MAASFVLWFLDYTHLYLVKFYLNVQVKNATSP